MPRGKDRVVDRRRGGCAVDCRHVCHAAAIRGFADLGVRRARMDLVDQFGKAHVRAGNEADCGQHQRDAVNGQPRPAAPAAVHKVGHRYVAQRREHQRQERAGHGAHQRYENVQVRRQFGHHDCTTKEGVRFTEKKKHRYERGLGTTYKERFIRIQIFSGCEKFS